MEGTILKKGDLEGGMILKAVVREEYQEAAISYVPEEDVDTVINLLDVIRNMGNGEYKAALMLIKGTALKK